MVSVFCRSPPPPVGLKGPCKVVGIYIADLCTDMIDLCFRILKEQSSLFHTGIIQQIGKGF